MVTTYHLHDIKDYEEFINKLFIGLKHYQKQNSKFTFKLLFGKDNTVTLKTIRLDASHN